MLADDAQTVDHKGFRNPIDTIIDSDLPCIVVDRKLVRIAELAL